MEEDKCEKTLSGQHSMGLKDDKHVLEDDMILGPVAAVICTHCARTGVVRLHWEEVDWDE